MLLYSWKSFDHLQSIDSTDKKFASIIILVIVMGILMITIIIDHDRCNCEAQD